MPFIQICPQVFIYHYGNIGLTIAHALIINDNSLYKSRLTKVTNNDLSCILYIVYYYLTMNIYIYIYIYIYRVVLRIQIVSVIFII